MRKIVVLLMAALFITSAASAKEYAIIKDTMFGSQKISKRVLDKIRGDLPIEIDRALSRVLKGAS